MLPNRPETLPKLVYRQKRYVLPPRVQGMQLGMYPIVVRMLHGRSKAVRSQLRADRLAVLCRLSPVRL
jgi:hypothetical protein